MAALHSSRPLHQNILPLRAPFVHFDLTPITDHFQTPMTLLSLHNISSTYQREQRTALIWLSSGERSLLARLFGQPNTDRYMLSAI